MQNQKCHATLFSFFCRNSLKGLENSFVWQILKFFIRACKGLHFLVNLGLTRIDTSRISSIPRMQGSKTINAFVVVVFFCNLNKLYFA